MSAWVAATLVGAISLLVFIELSFWFRGWGNFGLLSEPAFKAAIALLVWFVVVVVSGPFALVAVHFVRFFKLPRPSSDLVGAMAIAAILPDVVNAILRITDETLFVQGLEYTLPSGLMTGLCYRLFAGRPRPPYSSGQPPTGQSRAP